MDEKYKKIFDSIEPIDFKETRHFFDINICMIKNPVVKRGLCRALAAHYRHLAQIDGIKESALEEADFFEKKYHKISKIT